MPSQEELWPCWVCGGHGDNQRWKGCELLFSWCNECHRACGGCPPTFNKTEIPEGL